MPSREGLDRMRLHRLAYVSVLITPAVCASVIVVTVVAWIIGANSGLMLRRVTFGRTKYVDESLAFHRHSVHLLLLEQVYPGGSGVTQWSLQSRPQPLWWGPSDANCAGFLGTWTGQPGLRVIDLAVPVWLALILEFAPFALSVRACRRWRRRWRADLSSGGEAQGGEGEGTGPPVLRYQGKRSFRCQQYGGKDKDSIASL